MQKLWYKLCDVCSKILQETYIEVIIKDGRPTRHYCSDECRLKHSEKNVKQINYINESKENEN